jgi:hypothetical protein
MTKIWQDILLNCELVCRKHIVNILENMDIFYKNVLSEGN